MSVKRVVVDTNVVISALTAGGTPQKIIKAWITGEFVAVLSIAAGHRFSLQINLNVGDFSIGNSSL